MKLILIRSPRLLFYKMKSKKKIHDDGYNYNVKRKDTKKEKKSYKRKGKLQKKLTLKHICMKTTNSYYRKTP